MISAAQARHPDATFVRADPFAQINPLTGPYDVVFCSGTLNLNLGNNRPFLARAVDRFFELAGRFVVFNLLHIRMAEETHRYFYHDPDDVLDMLRPYPGTARLIDDYLPNDFTIVCDLDEPGDGAPLA
jgi:hypothetical protein